MKATVPKKWIRLAAPAATLCGMVASAHGAISTQTVSITPQTILSASTGGSSSASPLTATFNQFNPALGTLTNVGFTYTYNYNTTTGGTLGGAGGGAANGNFLINGIVLQSGGQAVVGTTTYSVTAASSGTFNLTSSSPLVPDNSLSAVTGAGTYTFSFQDVVNYAGGGPSGAPPTTVALVSPSSDTVTYTYTAAVPEPASLSLLGLGAIALLRRRKPSR